MRKREKKKERAAEGDKGRREARCDQRQGRRRDENAERAPARQKLCLVLFLIEQEAAEHGDKTCKDERKEGSGGTRSRRRAGEGAQIHNMHEMLLPPALFIKAEQQNANHETRRQTRATRMGNFKDLI